MFNVQLRLRKEYMSFQDNKTGNPVEMQGIRVILGPKVEKFFIMENLTQGTNSNLELLGYTNPNIVQWYMNSNVGSEITLREVAKKSIPVKESESIREIYSNSENEL